MKSTGMVIRKNLILWHRWMGVVFSVLFAVWFVSGLVMMYWPYPAVSADERLAKSDVIQPERVKVGLEEAERLAAVKRTEKVRLTMLDGRPVYRFHVGRLQKVVYADRLELFEGLSRDAALRVASAWSGQPPASAHFDGALTEEDQWTLNKVVRPLRPFLRFSWPDGQEVYVSQVTGEVMQHTTSDSRMGAYWGAIPHWLYFTPLRKETPTWRAVVIVLSLLGSVMTIFGIAVGIWLYSPSKRFRFASGPSSIPYAGWKRWHTVLGLVFGLMTFTWILSGMFSMNPMHWSPEFGADPEVSEKMRGARWNHALFAAEDVGEVLNRVQASGVKEVDLAVAGGKGVYLLRTDPRKMVRVEPAGGVTTGVTFEQARDLVTKAMGNAKLAVAREVRQYESYYIDREGKLPLPAYYFEFDDAEHTMHYVDATSGRLVQSYVTLSRWNRWLYHGLHSLDFPWLYANRPAWDAVVILPLTGGFALCVTSVWIAWIRVKRKAAQMKLAPLSAPSGERYSSLSR